MIENEAKQPRLIDRMWVGSSQWSYNPYLHWYLGKKKLKKFDLFMYQWNLKKNHKGINVYHVCLWWFLVVGCLTFFCGGKFLCMFHSIGVFIFPHSPSKNSKTQAYGMYAISIETLFWPPCHMHMIHTKSVFENWNLARFWTSISEDFGVLPMLEEQYDVCLHQKIIHNSWLKHKP